MTCPPQLAARTSKLKPRDNMRNTSTRTVYRRHKKRPVSEPTADQTLMRVNLPLDTPPPDCRLRTCPAAYDATRTRRSRLHAMMIMMIIIKHMCCCTALRAGWPLRFWTATRRATAPLQTSGPSASRCWRWRTATRPSRNTRHLRSAAMVLREITLRLPTAVHARQPYDFSALLRCC